MSTFDLGKIKFQWRGSYDAATTYASDDVVFHGGSAWVYVHEDATAGNAPSSSSTHWNKMAQGSDLGSITGLAAGSIIYFDGSDFTHLPAPDDKSSLIIENDVPSWRSTNLSHELVKVTVYTPSFSKVTVTEGYNWYGNVYVDYTPQHATTSADKIEATWDFQKGRHNGYGMLHARYYEADTELCRRSWAANDVDDSGIHTVWWHNGYSGERRLGWKFRSYNSSHRPIVHAPYHFDGGGSSSGQTNCQPQYVIKEYVAK